MLEHVNHSSGNIERRGRRAARFAGVVALAGTLLNPTQSSEAALEPLTEQIAMAPNQADTYLSTNSAERRHKKPNIIMFMADDMDESLLRYMPNTRKYIFDGGADFTNYFTNISLCCPARAGIMTGKYAHNTGVTSNEFPGGFYGFHVGDERKNTSAVWLEDAGYTTSLMGKYLNDYPYVESARGHAVNDTFVPNGWSDWAVPVQGQFEGMNYKLNLNGRTVNHQGGKEYLGDLMTRRAIKLIKNNHDDQGLMLEQSYYGPHSPEPTSPKERHNRKLRKAVSRIDYPRTPAFNEANVSDKPGYVRNTQGLSENEIRSIDANYRRRILSVKSIDRYVGMIRKQVKRSGQLDNTYFIFTSDNGYHMGEHRMRAGKNAPYDTDIALPLGISGPGIEPGTKVDEVTANIDIAPTLADIAGAKMTPGVDGESLLPLAEGEHPDWRNYMLVQKGTVTRYGRAGSSREYGEPGLPGQYEREKAIDGYVVSVSGRYRFIRYGNGYVELYDMETDPHQLYNLLSVPENERSSETKAAHVDMRTALDDLIACKGDECNVQ